MGIKAIVSAVAFLAFLSLPKFALAGGGLVFLDPRPNIPTWGDSAESRMYVVHAYIAPSVPCRNIPITFKFEDPKEGDRINLGSQQQPYIIQEANPRWVNGRIVYDCSTYAKVFSADKSQRYLYTEVGMPDGSTYQSSKVSLSFQFDNPGDRSNDPTWTPWDNTTSDVFGLEIVGQRYIDGPKREVELKWKRVDGVVKYNVYVRLSDEQNYGAALLGTGDTSVKININAFLDYYVKVEGCFEPTNCKASEELLVSRMPNITPVTATSTTIKLPTKTPQKNIKSVKPTANQPTPKISVVTTSPQPSTTSEKGVEELNKKIENLQSQLNASKARQSLLEERLNQITNWLKSRLPFFKFSF